MWCFHLQREPTAPGCRMGPPAAPSRSVQTDQLLRGPPKKDFSEGFFSSEQFEESYWLYTCLEGQMLCQHCGGTTKKEISWSDYCLDRWLGARRAISNHWFWKERSGGINGFISRKSRITRSQQMCSQPRASAGNDSVAVFRDATSLGTKIPSFHLWPELWSSAKDLQNSKRLVKVSPPLPGKNPCITQASKICPFGGTTDRANLLAKRRRNGSSMLLKRKLSERD